MVTCASRRRVWLAVAALTGAIGACGDGEPEAGTPAAADVGAPVVYTVNYPLQYFAQRIGGDIVQVVFPAPADEDPAFWMPDAEVVAEYQEADLILLNGAGYAKWTTRVSLPASRLVNTSSGFEEQLVRVEGTVTHAHGPAGEHAHEGTAFTTWLDPTQAIQQAEAIERAFSAAWPEHEPSFREGFESLQADLLALEEQLSAAFRPLDGRPLMASHPVYQYIARRYDLDLESVQWEPSEMPTSAMWRQFRELLQGHPARLMLWEGAPSAEITDELVSLEVFPVVFDQCGNAPEEGDYLSVMRQNAENLGGGRVR